MASSKIGDPNPPNGLVHLSVETKKELASLFDENLFTSPLIKTAVNNADKQAKNRYLKLKQQQLYTVGINTSHARPIDTLDKSYDYKEEVFYQRVKKLSKACTFKFILSDRTTKSSFVITINFQI